MKSFNVPGSYRWDNGEALTDCTRGEKAWGSNGLGAGKRCWGWSSGPGLYDLKESLQGPASSCKTTRVLSSDEVEWNGFKSKLILRNVCTWLRDHICDGGLDFDIPIQTRIRMKGKKKSPFY